MSAFCNPSTRFTLYLLAALGTVLLNACQVAAPQGAPSPAGSAAPGAPAAAFAPSPGVGAVVAPPSPSPPSVTKLISGYAVFGTSSLPLFLAQEAGLFEQNGLDVE